MNRRGYALVAVLWVVATAGVVSFGASAAARRTVSEAAYRMGHSRASWMVKGCVAVLQAAGNQVVSNEGSAEASWWRFEHIAMRVAEQSGCAIEVEPAGVRLDVKVSPRRVAGYLRKNGVPASRADSMADALADWIDPDGLPRPFGAEETAYLQDGRQVPSNRALSSLDELALVQGWDDEAYRDLVTIDNDPVPLSHATVPLLSSLPGVTLESARAIAGMRISSATPTLEAVAEQVSRVSRDSLEHNMPHLSESVVSMPSAWIVTLTATDKVEGVRASIRLRVLRASDRVVLTDQELW